MLEGEDEIRDSIDARLWQILYQGQKNIKPSNFTNY